MILFLYRGAIYFMTGAYCHKVTCHKVRKKTLTDFHILRHLKFCCAQKRQYLCIMKNKLVGGRKKIRRRRK